MGRRTLGLRSVLFTFASQSSLAPVLADRTQHLRSSVQHLVMMMLMLAWALLIVAQKGYKQTEQIIRASSFSIDLMENGADQQSVHD